MRNVIDTASSQRNLNFATARSEGFTDVYVKMGGDNVDTYVAPYYKAQVDAAIAAGFQHVGHYWVPDANPNDADSIDTPAQQADYMIDRLHRFDKVNGFIVLDNESLDGAFRFSDAQAAEFIERVKSRLGISGRQVFTYSGLADARGTNWQAVLATGSNFIIAAYSYGPFAWVDFPSIPRSRIVGHQTGGRAIGGVVTDTNVFTDDAFNFGQPSAPAGGVKVTLEQKAREFARKYPTSASHPNGGDGDWDQDCGRVMFRFGEWLGWITAPRGDISSAYRAYLGSKIESLNPVGAPIGAYHFWDIGGEANGHVAQQVDTNTLIFMGSFKVWEDLGKSVAGKNTGIGFASVDDYNAKTLGERYLGWSRDYSGGRPNLASVSGIDVKPIEDAPVEAAAKEEESGMGYTLWGRKGGGDNAARGMNEWSLVGRDLGYAVGHRPEDAVKAPEAEWAVQYGYRVFADWDYVSQFLIPQYGFPVAVEPEQYVKVQGWSRDAAAEHDRVEKRLITDALAEQR